MKAFQREEILTKWTKNKILFNRQEMTTKHILIIVIPTVIIMTIGYFVRRNLAHRHKKQQTTSKTFINGK